MENARLLFGQECVASRSLVKICVIKLLPSSGLQFHVRRLLMVSDKSSRASLAVLESVCIFRMGLSVILLIIIFRFATFNQQNAQYCSLDSYITLSRLILVHVSIHKGSTSGNLTKTIACKTKLAT